MPETDPIPWYPTDDEIKEILDEVWRDEAGVARRLDAISPLGDPPVPIAHFRGLTYGQKYPPPLNAGWTRVKPGPYIYPESP